MGGEEWKIGMNSIHYIQPQLVAKYGIASVQMHSGMLQPRSGSIAIFIPERLGNHMICLHKGNKTILGAFF